MSRRGGDGSGRFPGGGGRGSALRALLQDPLLLCGRSFLAMLQLPLSEVNLWTPGHHSSCLLGLEVISVPPSWWVVSAVL